MGLLYMIGAGLLGWKYGDLRLYRFLVIAVISAVLVAMHIAANSDIVGMTHPLNIILSWALQFLALAVPYAVVALVKRRLSA